MSQLRPLSDVDCTECHYVTRHYAECRSVSLQNLLMLNVIVRSVIMQIVVILSVVKLSEVLRLSILLSFKTWKKKNFN